MDSKQPFSPKVMPEDITDAYAIQAVARGEGGPIEQERAIKCIIEELAGTYAMTFNPESESITAFNEGSRKVGRAIVGIINCNLGTVERAETRILDQRVKRTQTRKGKGNG